jgi:hypothetical protein
MIQLSLKVCHPERSEGSAFSFDCIATLAKAQKQILPLHSIQGQDDNLFRLG